MFPSSVGEDRDTLDSLLSSLCSSRHPIPDLVILMLEISQKAGDAFGPVGIQVALLLYWIPSSPEVTDKIMR